MYEARRPLFSTRLWVPVLLILVACLAIVYYGEQVARTLERSVAAGAAAQGQAMTQEIGSFIEREQERLRAFVDDQEAAVRAVLSQPDDWSAIDALQASVRGLFRGALGFTVAGPDGQPLFEDLEGLVGPVCRAEMREYAGALAHGRTSVPLPPIHPMPDAFHFDLITPFRLEDGRQGVFFVSMSPERIAELIRVGERASGMRILLVNREEPSLIEVAASGARDTLRGDFRVEPEDLVPGHYAADLPNTAWRLLVIPERGALDANLRTVYLKVAALVVALLSISAALLYLIRRAEQRNSSLFTRSLQASASRQRAILQSMVDGLITIDPRGKIHDVNNAVTRLFGYEASELVGKDSRLLYDAADIGAYEGYLQAHLAGLGAAGLGRGRELKARRKDGSLFPVLLTLGDSFESNERLYVGILHDLTAYKAAQRKIVAQKVAIDRSREELDEISRIASQELQRPLRRIASLGASLGTGALDGSARAQLKSLTEEARDVSERVKGLAAYTRAPREAVSEAVDLERVLRDVQRDLAGPLRSSGAELTVGPLAEVLGDPTQLRQVFWNLIDNAIKFRDPERRPRIHVGLAPQPADSGNGQVTVQVSDNGIGIPEEQRDAVFEAFRRLHPLAGYPGAGLGLAICRKILARVGGSITLEPGSATGATFSVTLPRAGARR